MRNSVFLIIIICLCSCGSKLKDPSLITLKYIDTLYLESYIDSVSVIPLELTEKSIIDNVSRVIIHDDNIIIVDDSRTNKAVTFFHYSGKYIRRISHFGRGPGEYLSITALQVDKSNLNLYVYDNFSRRVFIYDSLGVYLGTKVIEGMVASDFRMLNEDVFLFYSPDEYSEFKNSTYPKGLLKLDLKEDKLISLLDYSEDAEIIRAFNSGWFTQGEGFIGLLSSIENNYYKITNDKVVLEYSFLIPVVEIGVSDKLKEPAFKAYPVESTNYLFFYVFFKDVRQFFPVIIDKEDEQGFIYSWIKGFLDSTATIFQGANSECFYRVIMPQSLTPEEVSTLNKEFRIQVSENDNPLLVIYHLKQ